MSDENNQDNAVLKEAIEKMRSDVNPIRWIRKAQGLKADDLANKASLSAQSIWKIEKGTTQPRLDTLYQIALALELVPQTLVDAYQRWSADKDKPADELVRLISADPEVYARIAEDMQVVEGAKLPWSDDNNADH